MSWLLKDEGTQRPTREAALEATDIGLQAQMRGVLEQSDLLVWIAEAIARMGVAGEGLLAMLIYLVGTSRLLKRPLAAIVQGASAAGKSYVIERVAGLFPPEAVLRATDMSPQALYYLKPGELKHRMVVAGERSRGRNDESAIATKAWREMLSSGRLTKQVAICDGDGPRTETVEQEGPIAYIESTTAQCLFEEDANRCLILRPDERPEQTRTILSAYGRALSGVAEAAPADLGQQLHCLQLLLEPLPVVVPFANELMGLLPDEPIEMRRVAVQIVGAVQASAVLHQFQRERDERGQIIAVAEDYSIARGLLSESLAGSLCGKPAAALRRFVGELKRLTGELTTKEIAKQLKTSERTTRERLNELHAAGQIEQTQAPRGPTPARWRIENNIRLPDDTVDLLPSVADVCGVDDSQGVWSELQCRWASDYSSDVPF